MNIDELSEWLVNGREEEPEIVLTPEEFVRHHTAIGAAVMVATPDGER